MRVLTKPIELDKKLSKLKRETTINPITQLKKEFDQKEIKRRFSSFYNINPNFLTNFSLKMVEDLPEPVY